jgi:hypothetical protein
MGDPPGCLTQAPSPAASSSTSGERVFPLFPSQLMRPLGKVETGPGSPRWLGGALLSLVRTAATQPVYTGRWQLCNTLTTRSASLSASTKPPSPASRGPLGTQPGVREPWWVPYSYSQFLGHFNNYISPLKIKRREFTLDLWQSSQQQAAQVNCTC